MRFSKKQYEYIIFSLIGILLLLALPLVLILLYTDFLSQPIFIQEEPESSQLDISTSPFLEEVEVVVVSAEKDGAVEEVLPLDKVLFKYVMVTDGCGIHFEGECLNVRSGPGTDFPVVSQLRNDIVLKVGGSVDRDGELWYKIVFDEFVRYPERIKGDWYVSADYVDVLYDEGDLTAWEHGAASTTQRIVIDRSEQKLYAYENEELVMEVSISTGLALTPTPRGEFTVFKKTPSRYMQGPLPGLPSDQYYDLPGVPWNLYFTEGGAVIHGAYWHDSFGSTYSHGCVNLPPEEARRLYTWAKVGATVLVRD